MKIARGEERLLEVDRSVSLFRMEAFQVRASTIVTVVFAIVITVHLLSPSLIREHKNYHDHRPMTIATITIPNMIKITQIIFQRQLALCLRSGGQQQGGRARRELELQCVTTIALVRWRRATSGTTLNFSLYLNPGNY